MVTRCEKQATAVSTGAKRSAVIRTYFAKADSISRGLERRLHVRQVSDAGVMLSDVRHLIESGSGEMTDIEVHHEPIRHVECFLELRGC